MGEVFPDGLLAQESLNGIGLRRKQLSVSGSLWPDSDRTSSHHHRHQQPLGVATGSLEERACVFGTTTSPPVLQARTQRATEPR